MMTAMSKAEVMLKTGFAFTSHSHFHIFAFAFAFRIHIRIPYAVTLKIILMIIIHGESFLALGFDYPLFYSLQ